MKKLILVIAVVFAFQLQAQDFNEELTVPLSNPGKKGKLEVSQVRGDITVKAYDGKDVIVKAHADESRTGHRRRDNCRDCDEKEKKKAPEGMKRISASPIELEVSENNNTVEIETNSWKKAIHLEIMLPSNFDLDVSTVHGKINVEGIEGEHEIASVNGSLTMTDMKGSIICNTVNGGVTANLQSVTPNEPMSFVTLNGDVDVTFPSSVKATAKMRSDRGEIYTDFDMSVDKANQVVKSNDSDYKVSVNSWVFGAINGGGAEYTFKNMNGDIIIRKD